MAMTNKERALEKCDQLGITKEHDRKMYVSGYADGFLEGYAEAVARWTSPRKNIPDAETR